MNDKLLEVVMKFRDKFSPGIAGAATKVSTSLGRISAVASRVRMGIASAFTALKSRLLGIGIAIAGIILVLRQVSVWMSENIRLANEQEASITALNSALMAAGEFSEEASQGLQDYAKSLQALLGIGDEVTFETLSIVEGITKMSAEALPDAMQAIVQISNLYKVDYKNAAILLGKSLTSNINAFSRYGIEIDLAGSATERLTEIMDATSAGMEIATAKAETYEGRMAILTAAWGDFREQIGQYITSSPGVNTAITFITEKIIGLTTETDNAREASEDLVGKGFIKIIDSAIWVGRGVLALGRGFSQLAIWIKQASLAAHEFIAFILEDDLTSSLAGTFSNLVPGARGWMENTLEDAKGGAILLREEISNLTADINASFNSTESLTEAQTELARIAGELTGLIERGHNPLNQMTDDLDEVADAAGGAAGAINSVAGAVGTMEEAFSVAFSSIQAARDAFEEMSGAFLGDLPFTQPEVRTSPFAGIEPGGEEVVIEPDIVGLSNRQQAEDFFGTEQFAASAIRTAGRGGGVADFLPLIGSAFGPVGSAVGAVLGGLFGKKQKPRGNDPSKPIFTSDIGLVNVMTDLLNVTKINLGRRQAGGVNAINAMIRAQAGTSGAA